MENPRLCLSYLYHTLLPARGHLLCTSRIRTKGPLFYRRVGKEKEREKVSGMEPNEMLIKTPRPFNGLEISIMFFIARINLNIFLLALSNS